ncbi:tripartite tricarboxylate transporter substrate binding protein [Achromobacter denitrificans]|uniref:Tripartite tricarboxylate transporter substrate binding protein n=1 Tax=Achromobacter denitrificans TaxID=32002 RepID=A0A6N0JH91_ACHDE|nr:MULTISPECIES: tripartite tricarboxylate transporter substrate binding protein [Achromobacter]ASC66716.1 ABC transporter substrate-binding protein [Achromobacter denitrificans]MBV2158947.1 tripartite tricarboxylate transporter substrate binding protein [Achromobacter denitrificans]MDF3851451.1 tripartite tricarboxylate transporter substrate binding protein [Achromobacter denitrificans]MDF3861347.1 tripartite tricarboxylate transporter substrate binding protein [Achromobacter denitrificans]MD
MMKRLLAGVALACIGAANPALAQDSYPNRPVRIVVPFSPGGATDIMSRVLAEKLGARLGQPVIVENKPGGGTMIASDYVSRADPDGYTLLMAASSLGIAPSIYAKVNYDPIKDFTPVTQVASVVHVLEVHPSVPAKNVGELIAYLKANPGKVSYGSVGTGSSTHLEAELFNSMAGVQMTHIPYKGSAPALNDLVAGRLQVMFDAWASSGPFVKDGKLRVLAVTTAQPSASVPDLPTVAASGLPGYSAMPWLGLVAPARTPQPVVDKLYRNLAQILEQPDVKAQFVGLGLDIIGSDPKTFGEFIRQDVATWAKVARDSNIRLE